VKRSNLIRGFQGAQRFRLSASLCASLRRIERRIQRRIGELLEAQHGERLDFETSGAEIGADSAMATVGESNRAEDTRRKGTG